MRAVFGVVSLLIALAIVGFVAVKQLRAVGQVGVPAVAEAGASALPAMSGSGPVREQSQQLQQKARSDVVKALEQGAAARTESTDK